MIWKDIVTVCYNFTCTQLIIVYCKVLPEDFKINPGKHPES